jgi:predicted SnoaL-like aldol condensation-catalyzing enzyme
MYWKRMSIAAAMVFVSGMTASFAETSQQENENKRVADVYLHAVMVGDYNKIAPYLSPEFKTHDWHVKTGDLAAFKAAVQAMAKAGSNGGIEITGERNFVDGDYVIVHHALAMKGAQERKIVGVEILKFSKGKIVEQWNLSQPVPAQSANGNGIF